jgi:YD repeat-containing protein
MKRITAKITSLMVIVLLWVAAGYAQYAPRLILKVDVPFEFSMGKKTFPAGSYQVVRIAPYMLALHDSKNGFLASVVTAPVVSRKARFTPTLQFEFDGEHHVLSQVWPGSGTTGYELPVPKRVTYVAQQQQPVEVQASQAGKQ